MDECLVPSLASGSETTCERPNQEAQWCVVPMLGLPSRFGVLCVHPGQSKSSPVRSGVGSWELKPRAGPDYQLTESPVDDDMPQCSNASAHATRRNHIAM